MYSEFKQHVTPLIEQHLARFCEDLAVVGPLKEAVHYALFPAGKRIRPLLALACCRDLGGNVEELARPACALELLHASSLVHDDLPALDNDDFRRGRPSCHKRFGEATAILAGDLLISAAFSLTSGADRRLHALTQPLASAFVDVCHGQQRDLMQGAERGSLDLLHRLKTGALFRAAMQLGFLFSGSNGGDIEKVSLYGETLGIYFQINDDLIDLQGNEDKKGRPAGSDQRNRRETYAAEVGMQPLEEKRNCIRDEMERLIENIERDSGCRMQIVRALASQLEQKDSA